MIPIFRCISHFLFNLYFHTIVITVVSEMNVELVRAIITGAGSGLGLATARMLASRGAKVEFLPPLLLLLFFLFFFLLFFFLLFLILFLILLLLLLPLLLL